MDFGKLCLLKLYTAKLATASERIPIFFAVNGRILKWEMAPQLQEKIAITLHRRLGARLRQSAIQAGLDWLALLAWGSGDQAACAPAVKNLERLIGKFRIIDVAIYPMRDDIARQCVFHFLQKCIEAGLIVQIST